MIIPTECPRCESPQGFIPKLRDTEFRWQEEYIRCTVCRFDMVLRYTTSEIEVLRRKALEFSRREDFDRRRGRDSSATLVRRHQEVRSEISKLIGALAEEIRHERGPTAHPNTA